MAALASMSAVRVPGFVTTISASKSLEPSGVTRLTICTLSTVPLRVVMRAGMETVAVCPALISPA